MTDEPIKFEPRVPRLSAAYRATRRCYHDGEIELDPGARRLSCKRCGAALDCYDWLETWIRHNERAKNKQEANETFFGLAAALAVKHRARITITAGAVTVKYQYGGKWHTRTASDHNMSGGAEWAVRILEEVANGFAWRERYGHEGQK